MAILKSKPAPAGAPSKPVNATTKSATPPQRAADSPQTKDTATTQVKVAASSVQSPAKAGPGASLSMKTAATAASNQKSAAISTGMKVGIAEPELTPIAGRLAESGWMEWLGTSGNDLIEAGEANDWISGGAGDDRILAGAGSDLIHVGDGRSDFDNTGKDTIDGGDGADIVSFQGVTRSVKIDLSRLGPQDTGVGIVTLARIEGVTGGSGADCLAGGSAPDNLSGGPGDDVISGGGGGDSLWGQTGSDKIAGGAGADEICGGAGDDHLSGGVDGERDVFIYGIGDAGSDRIHEFEDGVDRLHFFGVAGFGQLTVTANEHGEAVITWAEQGVTITLEGVTPDRVTAEDFIFG